MVMSTDFSTWILSHSSDWEPGLSKKSEQILVNMINQHKKVTSRMICLSSSSERNDGLWSASVYEVDDPETEKNT
jgi:hypothetical protein